MSTPSLQSLQHAVAIAEQIQELEAELSAILHGASAPSSKGKAAASIVPAHVRAMIGPFKTVEKKKRTISASHRAAVSAAQKARWKKLKGAKTEAKPTSEKPKRKKSKMSAAGRAAIAAAQKLRWDKVRAEKAKGKKA